MSNLDINQLLSTLGKMDKKDLEKAIYQANQIMKSPDKNQIIDEFKKKMQ